MNGANAINSGTISSQLLQQTQQGQDTNINVVA
jgi:hypothetical protein